MANGGTVSIKNPGGYTFAVTVTPSAGSVTFLKSGGGTASFPESITGDETFTCSVDCAVTVSVKYAGREIAANPDATVTTELKQGCTLILQPSPELGFAFFAPATATTTQLEADDHAINTTGKYTGKMVWNTTTGLPLWADGPGATDTWSLATGVATHTPS